MAPVSREDWTAQRIAPSRRQAFGASEEAAIGCLGVRSHSTDFSEDLVRRFAGAMLDHDLAHLAWEVHEREGLAGGVHAEGFAQAAQADVLALAHVQLALLGHIQHDVLVDLGIATADGFLQAGGIQSPHQAELEAGLGAVAGRPRERVLLLDDACELAFRHRDDDSIVGFGDDLFEEGCGVEVAHDWLSNKGWIYRRAAAEPVSN